MLDSKKKKKNCFISEHDYGKPFVPGFKLAGKFN